MMNITQSPSGRVVRSTDGHRTFLPYPLPPRIEWTDDLVYALSRAQSALGELSREGNYLKNHHLFTRPFVTQEAVASSSIEGIQTTIHQFYIDRVQESGPAQSERARNDIAEVSNYVEALDYALARQKDIPLSLRLIREIHGKMMQGVRGERANPGQFRQIQNWIGSPGSSIENARYVPPAPEFLQQTLSQLELFFHDKSVVPLIQAACAHYQFEAIHPFIDGNGRVGRLLIVLILMQRNRLSAPLLYLSPFFEATRADYYRLLYRVSAEGAWHEWLIYFCNAVSYQSREVLTRIDTMRHLTDSWKEKVSQYRSSVLLKAIIDRLVENPFVTANSLVKNHSIAFTTAQRAIEKLMHAGVLVHENAESQRYKIYCAHELLSIIEAPAYRGNHEG